MIVFFFAQYFLSFAFLLAIGVFFFRFSFGQIVMGPFVSSFKLIA